MQESQKPAVLFLCTGNSARSQLGEALLRHRAGDQFRVYSAGTEPKGVNPFTIRVLQECGISTEGLRSKHIDAVLGWTSVNYLIAVCSDADRNCPVLPLKQGRRLSWPFEDPATVQGTDEEKLAAFRKVRDQMDAKIAEWLKTEPWKP